MTSSVPDAKSRLVQHLHDRSAACSATARFLLSHGTWYDPHPLPNGIERGDRGECYDTVGRLLDSRPELRYVEGWAVAPDDSVVEHHAWALDPDGNVVDPTFDGLAYMGFPRLKRGPFFQLPKSKSGLDRSIVLSRLHELAALWQASITEELKA